MDLKKLDDLLATTDIDVHPHTLAKILASVWELREVVAEMQEQLPTLSNMRKLEATDLHAFLARFSRKQRPKPTTKGRDIHSREEKPVVRSRPAVEFGSTKKPPGKPS